MKNLNKEDRMSRNNGHGINPDQVIDRVLRVRMELFRARENAEAMAKHYNDAVDELIHVNGLMKARILELEGRGAAASPVRPEVPDIVPETVR
jgi:hypothetical protein